MKAAIVQGPNQIPVYGEFEDPSPGQGVTVIHVAASALSNATRARAAGSHYSMTGGFPLVPGIDGVGRDDTGQRLGFLLPQAPFGGMAEMTVVPDALCLPIPDGVSDILAAALINPGQSPIGALRVRADLQDGETVLINGATGTTGQVAVQIAKHLGAGRVIATGRDAVALARLQELGADHTIDLNLGPEDVTDALTGHFSDGRIDVVLDYLSGGPTETVLAAAAQGHKGAEPIRYVIAGNAAGPATSVPTSVLGSTSIVVMGSGIGAVRVPEIMQSVKHALQIASETKLHIDVHEISLSDVQHAWTTDYGRSRVVFTT